MIRKLTHASWVFCAIGLAAASAPIIALEQKIAGIDVREENRSTREGKRRLAVLEKKYAEIDKKLRRSELEQFRSRMQERDHVVNEQSRSALARDVETRPRALGRAAQDAREDSGQDEEKMLDELGGRMLAVIETFAQQNGYDLVLDTSSPESGLLHFDPQIDITQPVIPEFDPFTETREYVLAVLRNAEIYRRLYNLPLRGRSFGAAAGS